MRYIYILLLNVSTFYFLYGQSTSVQGNIIAADTGQPLTFANVYYDGTSIGTNSDDQGKYQLTFRNHADLVVSYIGYEPVAISIDSSLLNKQINFQLNPVYEELETVEIENTRSPNWYRNLERFKKAFIGEAEFAKKTTILNPEVLIFEKQSDSLTLTARAKEPIVVKNKALGYYIDYTLSHFTLDPRRGYVYFSGYTRFEELPSKKSHKRRRRKAYLGSTVHFMKSLLNGKTKEEGFIVRELYRQRDTSKVTQEKIVKIRSQLNEIDSTFYSNLASGVSYLVKTPINPSIYIQNNKLSFKNHWQVIYKKENTKSNTGETIAPNQVSTLSMSTDSVTIYNNGLIDQPYGIIYEGFWAGEKVSDMLPNDYELTKLKKL